MRELREAIKSGGSALNVLPASKAMPEGSADGKPKQGPIRKRTGQGFTWQTLSAGGGVLKVLG